MAAANSTNQTTDNPMLTSAFRMHTEIDESLKKAQAIVALIEASTHDDTPGHVGDIQWAGMVARELIDKAIAASDEHLNRVRGY